MQLRRTVFGLLVGAMGAAGLISACATSAELGSEDDNEVLEAGAPDLAPTRDGSASPPKGSSSGGGKSSSGGSGGGATSSGGSSGSSSGSTSSGGASGMLPAGPKVGDPCEIANEKKTQGCGLCGKQSTTCDVGDKKWTEYTACTGEVDNGCAPGTPAQTDIACGYCGKQNRSCSNACKWITTSCSDEQPNTQADVHCMADTTKVTDQGCPAGNTRTWTCLDSEAGAARCTWSAPPSSECVPQPTFITAGAAGTTASRILFTSLQSKRTRPNGSSCPQPGALKTGVNGVLTQVKNTTAAAISVDVWIDMSPDRVIYIYGNSEPTTTAALQACVNANDQCSYASTYYDDDAESCLEGIAIPAQSSIWVLSADWSADNAAAPYTLNVKTRP